MGSLRSVAVSVVTAGASDPVPWSRAGVVGAGALVLTAALVTVLVLLARRRSRARRRPRPGYRGTAGGEPPRTVVAWQPDPPPGMPPGTVPKQPQTGPRRG